MIKIGNVELKNQIVAAPLAGISNPVYREIMHAYGAGLVVSEMISDKALHFHNAKTQDMCRVSENEHPVALQLFGSDPVTMAEASEYLTKNTNCDIIDINMGCPVQKVVKAHSGSYLMQTPEVAYDVMKAVVDHTDRPVTVKMRAGWDIDHINCTQIAKLAQKAGVSAVAVHGRTRGQQYSGHSNLDYIKAVKKAVSIPVIGNGDIKTPQDAKHMLEYTGCDAIMIGRGLLGKPFFLQEVDAYLNGGTYQEPSFHEKLDLAYQYAEKLCAYEGERNGICMMRGMAGWYISGLPYAAEYKNALSSITSLLQMKDIIEKYRKLLSEVIDK